MRLGYLPKLNDARLIVLSQKMTVKECVDRCANGGLIIGRGKRKLWEGLMKSCPEKYYNERILALYAPGVYDSEYDIFPEQTKYKMFDFFPVPTMCVFIYEEASR